MEQGAVMERPAGLDRLIKGLVGQWNIEVSIQREDGSKFIGSGNFSAKGISLGRGVHSVMSIDLKGLGPYQENVLWTFDQVNNEVCNLSVISDGRVRYHTGGWTDENTMELKWTGVQKEEGLTEEVKFSIISTDEVRGHIVVGIGSHINTLIDYVLRRG